MEKKVSKVVVGSDELSNINVQSGSDFALLEANSKLSRARTRPPTTKNTKKYFHHKRTTAQVSNTSNCNAGNPNYNAGSLLTGTTIVSARKSPYSARPHTARSNIAPRKPP